MFPAKCLEGRDGASGGKLASPRKRVIRTISIRVTCTFLAAGSDSP